MQVLREEDGILSVLLLPSAVICRGSQHHRSRRQITPVNESACVDRYLFQPLSTPPSPSPKQAVRWGIQQSAEFSSFEQLSRNCRRWDCMC